jgi:hypothetical protein
MKLKPLIGTTPWRAQTPVMRGLTLVVAAALSVQALGAALLGLCLFTFAGFPVEPIGHYTQPVLFRGHTVFVTPALDLAYRSAVPAFLIGAAFVLLGIIMYPMIENREKNRRTPTAEERQPHYGDSSGCRNAVGAGQRRFRDRLGFTLLGFAALYFLLNLAFSLYCVPVLSAARDGGVCDAGRSFDFLERFIPAIWRGVDVFTQAGNLVQAKVVGAVTEFIWGSAIVFAILIIGVSFAWLSLLSPQEREQSKGAFEKQREALRGRSAQVRQGRYFLLAFFLIFLVLAFYGNMGFDDIGRRAANTYVQAADFLFLIIQLSFVLLGVVILTGRWVEAILLRGRKTA